MGALQRVQSGRDAASVFRRGCSSCLEQRHKYSRWGEFPGVLQSELGPVNSRCPSLGQPIIRPLACLLLTHV